MEGRPVRSEGVVVGDEEDGACAYLGVYLGVDLRAIILGIVMPFWACCWRPPLLAIVYAFRRSAE
jgi:hypothetical protein